MFIDAELSQIPITDGRKAERRIVNLAAALREQGAKTSKIVVVDISVGGFKAEAEEPHQEGDEVWLKLAGLEPRRSRVVWTRDKEAGCEVGCEFEWPLHPRELEIIIAPAPRQDRQGRVPPGRALKLTLRSGTINGDPKIRCQTPIYPGNPVSDTDFQVR